MDFKVKILIVLILINFSDTRFRYRVMKLNCESSNKTVLQPICTFRSIKRESYLTVRGNSIRKFPNAKLTYISRRKNSDGYQKVLEVKDIEVCKIVKNLADAPFPFIKDFVNYIKDNAGGNFLNGCNIIGEIFMVNGTMANFSAFEMFPQGDYMNNFHVFDDFDSKIFNATLTSHISKFWKNRLLQFPSIIVRKNL